MNEFDKGNPPRPSDTPQEGNRSYRRQVYQNLMAVVEYLESKSPLPASQRQIQVDLKLSKGVVFDICWNLCDRGWAEDVGDGNVKAKNRHSDTDAIIGREVRKIVENYT